MDEKKNPSEPIPEKPSTFENQQMAPGKSGDVAEGKDPKKVPAEKPQVPAPDAAAEAALKKEAEVAKQAPPKPPTGVAPQPSKPADTPATPTSTSDAAGNIKPPAAAAAAKPAAPAAPAKPTGPTPQPWSSEMVTRFKSRYGSGIQEAANYVGQNYMVVDASIVYEVLEWLRDDEKFDYLVDLTCVHYPQREKQFEVVWILYSFKRNERLRIKTSIADGGSVPSVCSIWGTANWLEREAFDMFGVKFDGHPDLRRILMPEDWEGFPLRKDYGIIQQDQKWVQIHLGIESGQ